MANLRFNLVRFEDEATLTVFYDGKAHVANDSHPYWNEILKGVTVDDDPKVVDLFDLTEVVADKFMRLSDQVTVHSGRVFFDGDEVDNALTAKILDFIAEGVEDWKPLVKFWEKAFSNPEPDSRDQLFDWLANNAFSITEEGDIVGYKGMYSNGEEKPEGWGHHLYRSSWKGANSVNVDGVSNTGYVWQSPGSVVEMARSAVQHDPAVGCSNGLHIATFEYARGYGDVTALVHVNPRDMVSVPAEHSFQKARACRYTFVELVTEKVESALVLTKDVEEEPVDESPVTLGGAVSGGVFTPATDGPVIMNRSITTSDFSVGDRVALIGSNWNHSTGSYNDLYSRGVSYGDEGTVEDSGEDFLGTGVRSLNVRVQFDNGKPLYVAPECLELLAVDTVEDEGEDSWDSWEDSWEDDGGYTSRW